MSLTHLLLVILIAQVSYLIYASKRTKVSKHGEALYVDTSALMDGRIITAAQTGFLPSNIVITRSVINEMQLLADQADHEKRSRARRGLDAVRELQEMPHLKVSMVEDGNVGKGGVDERLIDLAKANGGALCTIDFNLNKAATALGVRVLNINELAGAIRMAFLPGETISMTLTQKGQSNSQAVGYLADGTMVVVDKASSKLNQTVEIEFIRSLQTAAGRMMFAKLAHADDADEPKPKTKPAGRAKAVADSPKPKKEDAPSSEAANQRPANRSRRKPQQRKRANVEDSLIELVNQQ